MSRPGVRFLSRSAIMLFATGALMSSGCSSSKQTTSEETLVAEGYARAVKMYEKNNYTEASLALETLLFTSRATALEDDVLYLLAQSYYQGGQYLLAADMFSRLLQQLPSSPFARASQFMLAKSYEHQSSPVELDQQETRKAIENFALYMDVYPMVDSAKQKGDIETYRELLKINPDNPAYKQGYADATARFARIDSLKYSEKAISRLREKLAKNKILIARQYVQLGKLKAAAVCYDELIGRYFDTTILKVAMEEKIDVLISRKKWFDAGQTLDQYLKRFPERKKEMQAISDKIVLNSKL